MGNNKKLNEASLTKNWSFVTWQWHLKRLNLGGKDFHGLDRAHIGILCGNQHNQEQIWDRDIMRTAIQNGLGNYPMLSHL